MYRVCFEIIKMLAMAFKFSNIKTKSHSYTTCFQVAHEVLFHELIIDSEMVYILCTL